MSRSETEGLSILGSNQVGPSKTLEVFPAPGSELEITIDVNEFTSFCPVTGQPDFGTLRIQYIANQHCLETKSFKLYLQSFRDSREFWEALAVQICEDLTSALKPYLLEVQVSQSTRGGMNLTAASTYVSPEWLELEASRQAENPQYEISIAGIEWGDREVELTDEQMKERNNGH